MPPPTKNIAVSSLHIIKTKHKNRFFFCATGQFCKKKLDSSAETGQFCRNWTVFATGQFCRNCSILQKLDSFAKTVQNSSVNSAAIFRSYWFGAVRKSDLLKTTPKILKLCRLVKNHKLNYSKK